MCIEVERKEKDDVRGVAEKIKEDSSVSQSVNKSWRGRMWKKGCEGLCEEQRGGGEQGYMTSHQVVPLSW